MEIIKEIVKVIGLNVTIKSYDWVLGYMGWFLVIRVSGEKTHNLGVVAYTGRIQCHFDGEVEIHYESRGTRTGQQLFRYNPEIVKLVWGQLILDESW